MTFESNRLFDIIYCDYIYENLDFSWARKYFKFLRPNGIFIAQTDWHSVSELDVYMKQELKAVVVNHLVWKCEWGNHPRNCMHQCYDDILVYSNGKNWSFYPNKIQVPKATISKGMNPSGRTTKQRTAWIDNVTLTTTAKERVKKDDGHLIRWQKPQRLYDAIIAPWFDTTATILDPFAGSFSLGVWCSKNNCDYTGIEYDTEVFNIGSKNIETRQNE
jgi:DNA modification methylase